MSKKLKSVTKPALPASKSLKSGYTLDILLECNYNAWLGEGR